MNSQPWSFVFHFPVPPLAALDPDATQVSYDEVSDTLYSELWPLKGPTISCVAGPFEYVRIELATRRPLGTQVEAFTHVAVRKSNQYLQLAAFCPELFRPLGAAIEMMSPTLKSNVVYRHLVQLTRAYDRRHGIRSSARRAAWVDQLQHAELALVSSRQDESNGLMPEPSLDVVSDEFRRAMTFISELPGKEMSRELDRLVQYWSYQPGGSIKRATGDILLGFLRGTNSGQYRMPGYRQPLEDYVRKSLRATA